MAFAYPDSSRATLDALAAMADGRLAESLRLDTAARMLTTTRRALELSQAGDLAGPALLPPLLAGWERGAMTAREYAESLPPAQLDRLVLDGARWASAMLRLQAGSLRRAA